MTWLRQVFGRGRADRELVQELNAHVAERVDDLVDGGMSEADARRQAAREFGNVSRHVEDSRAVWLAPWFESLWQDARYALRTIRRQPAFSASAILTLALGIGLVTALFTVFNATVLRRWPVPEASSIVVIRGRPPAGQEYGVLSNVEYRYFREQARSFTHLASSIPGGGPVSREDGSAIADVQSNYVTANYFDALGIGMTAGRGFLPDEEDYRAPKSVAVISERLWRESFASDPALLGHSIRVGEQFRTVVGVAAPGFADVRGRVRVDLWLPLPTLAIAFSASSTAETLAGFDDPRQSGALVFGRLRRGVSQAQAQAELDVLSQQFRSAVPMVAPGMLLTDTRPMSKDTRSARTQLRGMALMFMALFLVMLLACANVGNLILAKALARHREIAIRLSLGAGRARVTRQLLTESLVLSLVAGALALWLAITVPPLLLRLTNTLAPPDYLAPDALVFGFAWGMSVLACIFSGLAPALRATRTSLVTSAGDRHASSASRGRLRTVLLATQIALTTVLLVGAGLLTRAVTHAMSLDPGFAINEVQALSLRLSTKTPPPEVLRGLRDALKTAALPPVAFSTFAPITSDRTEVAVRLPGQGREMNRRILLRPVSANYFTVLDIPMLAGRTFVDGPARRELVVSDSTARRLWPNDNPIGKRLLSGAGGKPEESHEIVGVVADVATTTLTDVEPVIYWSVEYAPTLLVRDLSPAIPQHMKALMQAVAPGLDVSSRPLTDDVRQSLSDLVIGSRIAWSLGILALVLATIGVFGAFAYMVEERRREIGIRMALGARGPQVVRLVLGGARRPVLAGLAVGLGLSLVGAPLLRSALYGMSPFDPVAYLEIAVILVAAAMVATWIPARRATRVEPAITLRDD